MRHSKTKTCLISAVGLVAAHAAWADTMRCGNGLVEVGDSMAAVRSLCGNPADVQQSSAVNATTTRAGDSSSTVGTKVRVETWTYDRGPNQLLVSIRFVDGKVVAIDTLHQYGH